MKNETKKKGRASDKMNSLVGFFTEWIGLDLCLWVGSMIIGGVIGFHLAIKWYCQ